MRKWWWLSGAGIVLLLLAGVLFYWMHSGIEGRYRPVFTVILDGRSRYLELKDQEIYCFLDDGSFGAAGGKYGTYVNNEDGSYTLDLNGAMRRFGTAEPVDLVVTVRPEFLGMQLSKRDEGRFDIADPFYKRLYFWSLWFE